MTRRRRATSPIISRWTVSRASAGAPAVSAAAATITAGGATAHAASQRGTAALTLEEKRSSVSRTVVQTVQGVQSAGAIASTTHLAANNQEIDRQTINAQVAEPATRHRQGAGTRPASSARRSGHAVRPGLAIELSHRGDMTSG
ncbi:hypothetical protein [Actinomadura opuntiae]|uniref:hypothetical protein n=1 Tax=Actinomadura sp. OS1-43 TaxID=604315 RepID=UPI00255AB618|nr:hypothetical protein [Actinomadura sp. OS1-43]MDL4817221.1 hypothetical protein [Actinomadura sp. OS1-43]